MFSPQQLLRSVLCGFTFAFITAAQSAQPDCVNPSDPIVVDYFKAARLAEYRNDQRTAVTYHLKILESEPNNECVMTILSGLFSKMKYYQQALSWSERAIQANPKYVYAYISLGNAQVALRDTDEAKRSFRKAAELGPRDPQPYYRLGGIADEQQKYADAVKFYKRAIEIDPKFEDAYYDLAGVLRDLKRYAEAKDSLKKLLELNPNAKDAQQLLKQIERDAP